MTGSTTLQDLYRPVERELECVRATVGDVWSEVLALVEEGPRDWSEASGKMLRPALCLLSAGAAGAGDIGRFTDMAASMELFHVAALAHDDVIDGANLRRGVRSLNALWNDHAAVLGGDFLMARGISLMAGYGSPELVANCADCMREMAEGELRDFGSGNAQPTQERCLALARAKTAALFGLACATPAKLVRQEGLAEALHAFGMSFGMAFQLIDDLLDLTQNEATLGKPACGDLAAGAHTVSILFMREGLDEADTRRLDAMVGRALDDEEREWVAIALERSRARERTQALAQEYAASARAHVADLSPTPFRDSMAHLAGFILERTS